jgi:hypothetical protein
MSVHQTWNSDLAPYGRPTRKDTPAFRIRDKVRFATRPEMTGKITNYAGLKFGVQWANGAYTEVDGENLLPDGWTREEEPAPKLTVELPPRLVAETPAVATVKRGPGRPRKIRPPKPEKKVFVVEPKYCKLCAKEIFREPDEPPCRYKNRVYCSQSCSGKSVTKVLDLTKPCEQCGVMMRRNETTKFREKTNRFRKRKFCGSKCYFAARQARAAREARDAGA